MLHLIFQSPVDPVIFERITPEDSVVFMNNAVLGLLENGKLTQVLRNLSHYHFYALTEDMQIRGIKTTELYTGIKAINYAQLVELTVANPLIQSWP